MKAGSRLWRLGRSSKITAPTPIFADGLWVVASGRGPERPIFVVRPGARSDVTPAADASTSGSVEAEHTIRSYRHDLDDFALYFARALGVTPPFDVNQALSRLFQHPIRRVRRQRD